MMGIFLKKLLLSLILCLLSFKSYALDVLPEYWVFWEHETHNYRAGVDRETYLSKPESLSIQKTLVNTHSGRKHNNGAGIYQIINLEKYVGKKIRFSAYVKTQNVTGYAYIYARSGKVYPSKGIRGTNDWMKLVLEFDIPENHPGQSIHMAFSMFKKGRMWIDDIKWEVIGKAAPIFYEPILE